MRRLIMAIVMLISPVFAQADPALGTWKTEEGETGGYAIVKIVPCGQRLCGVVQDIVGNENKSPIAKNMIANMEVKGNGRYAGGTIWAPDNDKTYKSKMRLLSEDRLQVQGCVGVCTFATSRKMVWTRVN